MFGFFYGENMAKEDISRRVTEMLMPFLEENGLDIYKVEYKKVNKGEYIQKNLTKPSRPHRNPDEFWNDFNSKKFNFIIKKYGKNNIFLNYKYIIKKGVNLLCRKK